MPMSESEKNEIKEALTELYDELGSHAIEFLTYDINNNPEDSESYAELGDKVFLPHITLLGKMKLLTAEEKWSPKTPYQDSDVKFIFPVASLEDNGIIDLGEDLILKCRIRYLGRTYIIKSFEPRMDFFDTIFKYEMLGKRI